ncbi:hypothetical protein D9M71_97350 [compost metagenome]
MALLVDRDHGDLRRCFRSDLLGSDFCGAAVANGEEGVTVDGIQQVELMVANRDQRGDDDGSRQMVR